jgi:hypothetical protein
MACPGESYGCHAGPFLLVGAPGVEDEAPAEPKVFMI